MIDINKEIEEISKKYNLNKKLNLIGRIYKYLDEIFEDYIPPEARVAIRGNSGQHATKLVQLIKDKRKIVGIFDNYTTESEIEGIPVYPTQYLEDFDIDIIIVGSNTKRWEIFDELEKKYKFEIIDYYTILRVKYSLLLPNPFYEYIGEEDINHLGVIEAYSSYRVLENETTFHQLIIELFSNRDLFLLMKELNEYIEKGGKNKNIYINLLQDIQILIEEIKKELKKKNKKNIVIHWLDQVCYNQLSKLEYINNLKKDTLFFDSVFTVTPYTNPTMRTMFFKEIRGSERTDFSTCDLDINNSLVVERLKSNNYEIYYFGLRRKSSIWNEYTIESNPNIPISYKYWQLLDVLITSEEPIFAILHGIIETHDPYISPQLNDLQPCYSYYTDFESEKTQNQIDASLRYVDKIVEFYSSFLSDSTINIYLSDHGKYEDIKKRRYDDIAVRTWLKITGLNIENTESRIFSYYNFDKLLYYILDQNKVDYNSLFTEYAWLSDTCFYSLGYKYILKKKISDYNSSELAMAYKGVRYKEDKYIILQNGKEYYFIMPNENDNLINDERYLERINYLRYIVKNNN